MDTAERFLNRDTMHDSKSSKGVTSTVENNNNNSSGRTMHSDGKKSGLLGLSKAEIRKVRFLV